MSQSEDVGSMVMEQKNLTDLSKAQEHILAAQFECYLKIIHDPPQTEEGDKIAPFLLIMFFFQFKWKQSSSWNLWYKHILFLAKKKC